MKKDNITYLIFLIAICFTVFVSCEKEETFDGSDFDCESFNVDVIQHSCTSFSFTPNSVNTTTEMMVNGGFFDGGHPSYDWTALDAGPFSIKIIYEGEGCPNGIFWEFFIEIPEDPDCF